MAPTGHDAFPQQPAPGVRRLSDRQWRILVGAVFVVLVVTYVGSVPGLLFVKPDTMVYLGLARSIAEGEGYTYNFQPYGKYPPVYPLLLAGARAVSSEALQVRMMQTLQALLGVGALAAAYLLVRARAGLRVALAVVVLSGASTWFWSNSSVILLSEPAYALFSLLALWAAERAIRTERFSVRRWLLTGVLAAVAIYTHMIGVVLLPALVLGVAFARTRRRSPRQRALAGVLVAGLGLVLTVAWWVRGRDLPEMATYSGHVAEYAGEMDEGWDKMKMRLEEYTAAPLSLSHNQVAGTAAVLCFLLLVIPGLVEGFRRYRSCAEFYLCGHFVVSALMGGGTGRERYVVPVIPLLFYYGALSLRTITGWVATELEQRRRLRGHDGVMPSRWPHRVVVIAFVGIVGYGLTYRVKAKRGGKPFSPEARAEATNELEAWRQVGRWAEELIPRDANVCVGSGGSWNIAHYFLRRHVDAPMFPLAPLEMIEKLVEWDSDFLLYDGRELSQRRVGPTLEAAPQCFESLAENKAATLYRVRKETLLELLRVPEALTAPATAPEGGESAAP
jgi:hypothetical protein